jgi:predicted DNA-binding mobile mystery protein A
MRLAANLLDRRFEEIRPLLKQLAPPSRGWIKALREGLGMTTAQLARRMGVSQPRIAELEKAEAARNVTLGSLERAAEALDCRLVYVLVPNRPLSERLEERADQLAEEQLAAVDQTMKLEKQSVSNAKQRQAMKQRIAMALLDKPSRLWQAP